MTSAVITGSASGIGAATALRLAEPGTQLTLHTRHSADRLERAGQAVREKGAEVVTVMGDLAEADTAKRIVAAHLEKFGKLDALVANAGFPLLTSFEDMQAEDLDYAFRGNSQSLFHLVRESLDPMRKSAQGRIVVLSSFTAHVFRTDMPQFPASAASKGALETATRSLVMALA